MGSGCRGRCSKDRVDLVRNSKAGVMTTKQMLGVGDADGTLRLAYSMEKMRERFNKRNPGGLQREEPVGSWGNL